MEDAPRTGITLKRVLKVCMVGVVVVGIFSLFSTKTPSDDTQEAFEEQWANYDSGNTQGLDVDAIQNALKEAKGPKDFEQRVNEIYTGEEIVSINVQDQGNQSQVVTLYIDKDPKNGAMDQEERILSLTRGFNQSSQQASIQTTGYGPYQQYSYTSPLVYGLVSGLTHYWLMSSLMYNTPMSRFNDIQEHRRGYRQTPEYQARAAQSKNASKSRWGQAGKSGSWNRGVAQAPNQPRGSRSFSGGQGRSRSFFGK